MSNPVQISVKESQSELQLLIKKAAIHQRPKLKMLQCIGKSIHHNELLAAKTGAGLRTIVRWKKSYVENGLEGLLSDKRGQVSNSKIDAAGKEKLKAKLHDSENGFTTYSAIQDWIEKELKVSMNYPAVYMYLRRTFSTKLKVGRKSHVKKDEEAVAFFKKPVQ